MVLTARGSSSHRPFIGIWGICPFPPFSHNTLQKFVLCASPLVILSSASESRWKEAAARFVQKLLLLLDGKERATSYLPELRVWSSSLLPPHTSGLLPPQPCGVRTSGKYQLLLLDGVSGPSGSGRLRPFQHCLEEETDPELWAASRGSEKEFRGGLA